MPKPMGTRMNDAEYALHQSSSQWRLRSGFGQAWKRRELKKIADRHQALIDVAEKRFYAALAKANAMRDAAIEDFGERECDRANNDIREVAYELGICERPNNAKD